MKCKLRIVKRRLYVVLWSLSLSVMGASWRQFCNFLDAFWSLLDGFGSYFWAVCKLLETAWNLFEASWCGMALTIRFWELISRILERFWGFIIEEKIVTNGSRNSNCFQHRFIIHFQSFSVENGGVCEDIVYHCWLACDMHFHTAICSKLL